jgi:hypothetical protein
MFKYPVQHSVMKESECVPSPRVSDPSPAHKVTGKIILLKAHSVFILKKCYDTLSKSQCFFVLDSKIYSLG